MTAHIGVDVESGLAHSLAAAEKRKASTRAKVKVKHPFLYVKRQFGYAEVRYRGLSKNTQRIALLLGFANLLIAGRYATSSDVRKRTFTRCFVTICGRIGTFTLCA